MTLTEITTAMKAYNNIINDGNALVELYKQGSYFDYMKSHLHTSDNVHAYPGINDKGELIFFVIPSHYDTSSTTDITNYIAVCPIQHWLLGGGNVLPVLVAQEMCERWINDYETWIPAQVPTTNGMFLAFKIPAEDFETSTVRVNLALKKRAAATTGLAADVVVTNMNDTEVYSYDFAHTVPPMPQTLTNSYYLLSLV
ncbi:hypothetical protein AM493_18545 [Flavobacterium akiainvivens]|uniref:Uncharacterized protein n=1 Tax=Flavobacterium akiainvivens TaxID=1202724 RepID=A0A0N0RR20_9FLAO|nr:hypothetical protein [Flavobacterium akiainvivens]KOS07830.1 hypothetical protein AM493_18545 [Flavobacterium akiainvivens]SFQ27172.1 hypothetical protein SAMN05444144_102290 [Flavobacterium akiainvivens]